VIVEKTCEYRDCGRLFETSRPQTARFCSPRCRVAAFRADALSAPSSVSADVSLGVSTNVTAEIDTTGKSMVLPPPVIDLSSPEDCINELRKVYRMARLGKIDTSSMLRLTQAVREINTMLESKRQLEASLTPTQGCYIEKIEVVSVPPSHYVAAESELEIVRAIRASGKEAAVRRWLGLPPAAPPKLVSDVSDIATGEPLDPTTLQPALPPSA
jgi:hypothetical protein